MSLTDTELERYARHIVLSRFGGAGQQKLKAARVAVIGAGGIGSGAIPALAQAYGVTTVVDSRLETAPEVWIEAGDHERLLHLTHDSFLALMREASHGRISHE